MIIEHVSDTARWVAFYRAMESERPDPLFRDPFARRLAGPEGERIVAGMKRGRATAAPMIVRTAVFDELIYDALAGGAIDTVVNLAAGLDARPWRMELPPTLRWVDVDLPGILDYKLEVLAGEPARCDYRDLRADLGDAGERTRALRAAMAGSRRTLVLTEGLLVYLGRDSVGGLARDLHAAPAARRWITDLASPRLLRMMHRWGKQMNDAAAFRFAPEEGTAFFRSLGWREVSFRSAGEDARRLDRQMPGAWFWDLVGRLLPASKREAFRRFAGVVVLDRA